MTRLELFRQQAPEFDNITDDVVNAQFDTASIFLESYLDSISAVKLDLAIAFYAAHLFWLRKYPGQGGASRGPILNEADERMGAKKQYALIQNSDTWLQQSMYGQSFANLTKITFSRQASIMTRFGT